MVYDCGATLAKYILCLFNFIIFLAGTIVLGIGIWIAVDKNSFIGLSNTVPVEDLKQFTQPAVIEQASYVLIAIGGFMFIVSFLGYCGALKESQCMLTTYGICLLIILVLEITAGVLAVAYKSKAEAETKTALKKSIEKYYYSADSKDAVTLLWDHLQANLHCCGVDDFTDYRQVPGWADSNKKIPESCCVLEGDPIKLKPLTSTCTTNPNDANSYFQKGCYQAVMDWVMSHVNIVIGVAVGLALIELVGTFFAFCLTKSINQYSR